MLLLALTGVLFTQAPTQVDLAGTTWRFPPSRASTGTTVTFRKDGVAYFVEPRPAGVATFTGHWKQTETGVVFDANAFTEYRVVVNGSEMTGEWLRLRGRQKGLTAHTSAKKI